MPSDTVLEPGQHLRLAGQGAPTPVAVDPAQAMAWREGRFNFYDASLREVALMLQRHGAGRIVFLPPPTAIERIEVIRGPMSSLYGSAALRGVVHVITRPVPETWSGRADLGLSGGSGGDTTTNAALLFGGPLLRARLGMSLYLARRGWQQSDAADAPQSGHRLNDGARLSWTPDRRQRIDLDLWRSRLRFDADLRDQRSAQGQVDNRGASLGHFFDWPPGGETTSFLMQETTDFRIGNTSGHRVLTFGTRSMFPLGPQELTAGFEHRIEQTLHDLACLPDSAVTRPRRWHQSLYGEGRLALSPDLTVTVGLRHDRDQLYGLRLTPRVYAVWHATSALTLRGGIGGGYRTPALKQADDNVWEPSRGDGASRDRGNSALRPERSTNFELGMAWQLQSGAQVGATLFHSDFRDRISRRDLCRTRPGDAPACPLNGHDYHAITQYVNEDAARLRGVELTLEMPMRQWDFNANYTYSHSQITQGRDAGQPFNNLPRHALNLEAQWRASDTVTLWSRGRARSSMPSLGRSRAVAAQVSMDVGFDIQIGDDRSLSLGMRNIGNAARADPDVDATELYLNLGVAL